MGPIKSVASLFVLTLLAGCACPEPGKGRHGLLTRPPGPTPVSLGTSSGRVTFSVCVQYDDKKMPTSFESGKITMARPGYTQTYPLSAQDVHNLTSGLANSKNHPISNGEYPFVVVDVDAGGKFVDAASLHKQLYNVTVDAQYTGGANTYPSTETQLLYYP